MNFYDIDFLKTHSRQILAFYDSRIIDSNGGYYQNFYDNGTTFNNGFKQLISSTRIIVNYAMAASVLNKPDYLKTAQHGLNYLEQVHWQEKSQGYAWTLQDNKPLDMTQQAYGYAFVLLAYAAVRKAGITQSDEKLHKVYQLLEERFWQADYGLYADTVSAEGMLSDYRGQNANMHICEAMISAYEATENPMFLERASTIADNICNKQAALTNGLVWEHYTASFQPDWEYNKTDPKNLYRPWGFQPGHQTEWAKLLLQLYRHSPQAWLAEKAQYLFDNSFSRSWDDEHGGLIYGFDPQGNWCDDDKYFWVQAESFAAAALLFQVTDEQSYLSRYQKLWQYSWQHLVDHEYGAWFRILRRNNTKYSNEKSLAGAKCDYHSLGACLEVIRTLT